MTDDIGEVRKMIAPKKMVSGFPAAMRILLNVVRRHENELKKLKKKLSGLK